MFFKRWKTFFALLFWTAPAWAVDAEWIDPSSDHVWTSSQVQALGGTSALSLNFVDRFFLDPSSAAAPRKSKWALQFAGAHVLYSEDAKTTVSDVTTIMQSSSASSSSTQKILDVVGGLFGKTLSVGASINAISLQAGGFTLVPVYSTGKLSTQVDVPAWPRVKLILDEYIGLGVGYAFTVKNDFDFGINLRPGVRIYKSVDQSVVDFVPAETLGQSATDSSSTTALSEPSISGYLPLDFGLAYRPNNRARLFSVLKNLTGGTALTSVSGELAPAYPLQLSLGGQTLIWEGKGNGLNGSLELQDLTHAFLPGGAFWYRMQLAGQYIFQPSFRSQPLLALNLGLRSGYPSVGLYLDLVLFKLEAAYFTQELGQYIGQRPEKRMSFKAYTQVSF